MAAFLNLAILDSTILVFPLILTHTCQEWFPPFAQKNLLTFPSPPFAQKNFTHSFWLSLMMAAILNLCHLGFSHFAQKNFSHSFWLNLMMAAILNSAMLNSDTAILDSDPCYLLSDSLKDTLTPLWLWIKLIQLTQTHSFSHNLMMAAILNSAILDSAILHKTLTQTNSIWLKLIHSDSTWWWQPSWILPSCIQPFCTKKTSLIHSDSILMMVAAILNSAILHSTILHKILTQTNSIWLKLIHSLSTWWWQPSWILPSLILPSEPFSKPWLKLFNLTQTHSFSHNLMMAAILNSAILNSDTAILDSDPCYLLPDSLKNTLTPIWLWIILFQSASNSFLLT